MDSKIVNDGGEAEKIIDTMRLMSVTTGKLYDVQVLNLKCIPLVIFGEELSNEFQIDFDKHTIQFMLTGKSNYPESETKVRLEHLVKYVQRVIGNFEVSVILNKKAIDGKLTTSATGKGRKKPKPSRKKRLSKARKGR